MQIAPSEAWKAYASKKARLNATVHADMAELRCPYCGSVRVYRADGEYVCADCATVVDSVYVSPAPENDKSLMRRIYAISDKNKKFLLGADGRYMRYARLATLLVRYGYRHDREEEPEERKLLPSQRVINWISALCYQLNIPKIECVKAVEVYRKYRLKLQGIYPKNVAACCIFMAGLASEEQLAQAGVSKASLQYAKRLLLQKERRQPNLAPFLEYAIQLAKSAENWKQAIRQATEIT